MKRVSVAMAACVPACLIGLASCATSHSQDKVSVIVTAPYPGEHKLDQCSPYADALFNALKANNVEAWKVSYMGGDSQQQYFHAMVVYKDAGSYWYADDIFPFPTRSWGKTPRECARDRAEREGGFCLVLKVEAARAEIAGVQAEPAVVGKTPLLNTAQ